MNQAEKLRRDPYCEWCLANWNDKSWKPRADWKPPAFYVHWEDKARTELVSLCAGCYVECCGYIGDLYRGE